MIASSLIIAHRATRSPPARAAALAGLALALSLLPAAFGLGEVGLVGVLLLSSAPRAFVSTVCYPLATESAAGRSWRTTS